MSYAHTLYRVEWHNGSNQGRYLEEHGRETVHCTCYRAELATLSERTPLNGPTSRPKKAEPSHLPGPF